jgi:predicted PurR-regulated permease PerM
LMCLFIGIAVYLGLWILSFFWLDLPNKWTLALIAGITEFIPIIGPALGATPIALIALSQYGFVWLFVVAIFYTILQLFESHILIPLVMNQALGVSALLILIVMTLWGISFWFIGVMLGVPLAVIISLVFEDFIEDE